MFPAVVLAAALGLLSAWAAPGLAQGDALDGTALDWRTAKSRARACQIEEERFRGVMSGINERRNDIQAQCEKESIGCRNKETQAKREECAEEAQRTKNRAMAETDKLEVDAKRMHTRNLNSIERYWDRLRNDPGRTNRVDGRDARTFVEKVPKPLIERSLPTRLSKGEYQVRLPNGRWVPAARNRDGKWVPRTLQPRRR